MDILTTAENDTNLVECTQQLIHWRSSSWSRTHAACDIAGILQETLCKKTIYRACSKNGKMSEVDCLVIAINCFCMLLCQGLPRHPRVELARCTRARGCFLSPNCQNCCVAESLGPQIVKHIRIQNNMCDVVLDNSPNSACAWRFLLSL